jgi:hypothetical protein
MAAPAPALAPSPFLTGPSGRVIDGKAVADTIRAEVAAAVSELKEKTGGKVRRRRRRRRRRRGGAGDDRRALHLSLSPSRSRALDPASPSHTHARTPPHNTHTHSQVPGLAVVIVGDRKDSRTYVSMKHKACAECGVASFSCELPGDATQADVLGAVAKFNADPAVHGILVQLPVSVFLGGGAGGGGRRRLCF